MNGIATDAQHLGIILLEPAVSLPEEGGLAGSTRGEIKNVERQNDGLAAAILAEGNFSVLRGGQLEIRGYFANLSRHNYAPLNCGARTGRDRRVNYNPQHGPLLSVTNPVIVTGKIAPGEA